MIDVIQAIGDFFSSIGEWVSNTITQAHDLRVSITEWVENINTILENAKVIINAIMPPEIAIPVFTGIALIIAICVWEIIS